MKSGILAILSLTIMLASNTVRADSAIKKALFDKCDDAMESSMTLQGEEQADFITYLGRVIALPWDYSSESPFLSGTPSTPATLNHSEIWKTTSPERNLRAKQCALELVQKMQPETVRILPALVTLLNDQFIPLELRRHTQETLTSLAVAGGKLPQLHLELSFFKDLLKLSNKDAAFYAEFILIELRSYSIDALTKIYRKATASRRRTIGKLLKKIDPNGTLVQPALIALLRSGDDALRRDVLMIMSQLPAESGEMLSAAIELLQDVSVDVQKSAAAAINLMLDENTFANVKLDEGNFHILFSLFASTTAPDIRQTVSRLLMQFGFQDASYSSQLLVLSEHRDAIVRSAAISLLGHLAVITPAVKSKMFKALYDSDNRVRLGAIEALSHLKKETTAVVAAYIKLLASITREANIEYRQQVILHIASAVAGMHPGSSGRAMIPYFIDALSFKQGEQNSPSANNIESGESVVVAALLALGAEPLSAVIKALTSESEQVQKYCLSYLRQLRPVQRRTIDAVISTLENANEEIAMLAMQTLFEIGKDSTSIFEHRINIAEGQAKSAIAEALLMINPWNAKAIEVFFPFLEQLSCAQRATKSKLLQPPFVEDSKGLRLMATKELPKLQSGLLECLLQNPLNAMPFAQALLVVTTQARIFPELLSQNAELKGKVIAMMQDSGLSANLRFDLIQIAISLEIPAVEIAKAIEKLLNHAPNAIRLRLIHQLIEFKSIQVSSQVLIGIANREDEDESVRAAAVVALANSNANEFDAVDYLIRELSEERDEVEIVWLSDIPFDTFKVLFEKAINNLGVEQQVKVIRASLKYGAEAQYFVPRLVALLDAKNDKVIYEAAIALVSLSPEQEQLPIAFRKLVLTAQANALRKATLPSAVRPLFEQLLQESDSVFASHLLVGILDRISTESQNP